MKKHTIILSLVLSLFTFGSINGQTPGDRKAPPPPRPAPPKLSKTLKEKLKTLPQSQKITRERRENAYAKLLEGQRYIWSMRRVRARLSVQTGARLAKKALTEAVELNPNLAEAYTALAELSLTAPPQDIDEAIMLSQIAVRLDKDNFGGHRFLARLFTIKSDLGRGKINDRFGKQAIAEWKEITRLDPRNAEAWAFLSAFYRETGATKKRIATLKNWLASSSPLESGFYGRVLSRGGGLTTQNASIKLGEALIDEGKNGEALGVLTRAISDSPDNTKAVELLSQALDGADKKDLKPAIGALRQAVFANPSNLSLNQMLGTTIAKAGNLEDAAKFFNDAVKRYIPKDKISAAKLQLSLGDVYADADRTDSAIDAYKSALETRGIGSKELATDEERDFAFLAINKMIKAYKKANRFNDAKEIVSRYRSLFNEKDLSLDKELIGILREGGDKESALKAVLATRTISPDDYSLIRTHAKVLTDLGRVDEGVSIIGKLIDQKPANVAPSIMYDDYINHLFISSLYLQANRNRDAEQSAKKSILKARGNEQRQIGQLTLASAQQASGDFQSAEKILKSILKQTPENPIALNNLGYLMLESGRDFERALELIKKALKIDPKNPSYLDSLGWAYFKLEKFDEAEKYLKRAVEIDTSSATIFEHLGDVYRKKGKESEAKNAWKKALNFTSNSSDSKRIEQKMTK